MPKRVHETALITEAAAQAAGETGILPIQHISPGWGSSGYYSDTVLEQAAADNVIPAGTQMYADHPTDAEDQARPVRSVKDLVAVTVEDARLATDADVTEWGAEPGALVSKVQVVPGWRDVLEVVSGAIGVSIRGSATDVVEGEAEGRTGRIIEGLVAPVMSVDFVTRAGRGGRVLSLLESAKASSRAIARGVTEATVNDTREALQTALRDAHGGDDIWVWVRDFDETTVWFELEGSGADAGVYAQAYANDDGVVSLTGSRTEVRAVTHYVPAAAPDDSGTTRPSTESEEQNMPKIELEESEHRQLLDDRTTAVQERDEARAELARRDRTDRATTLIGEALAADDAKVNNVPVAFTALESRGLLAGLPVKDTDAGQVLDEDAFKATVAEAVKAKVDAATAAGQQQGSGVRGFGSYAGQPGTGTTPATESAPPTRTPWGREIKGA